MPQLHYLHRARRYANADFAELPYLSYVDFEDVSLGTTSILNGWAFGARVITYAGAVGYEDFETSTLSNNLPPDSGWAATGIVWGFTIAIQPSDASVPAGGTATFSITTVGGLQPIAYQWQKSGVNLVNGGIVSGATTSVLTLTGISAGDLGTNIYRCVVTDLQGQSINSYAASLLDTVSSWVARVVANGGATPSGNTQTALATFVSGCVSDGIYSMLKSFCFFPPDSLTAAITPVVVGGGNDPWTNHNFVSGDLNMNGLKGNGSSKYLDTGLTPSVIYADNGHGGLTAYVYDTNNNNEQEMGITQSSSQEHSLYTDYSGTTYYDAHSVPGGRLSVANSLFRGFVSGNTGALGGGLTRAIFAANGLVAHSAIASNSGAYDGTLPTHNILAFAGYNAYPTVFYSSKRLSFAAVHEGMTTAQSSSFYNRVQQLRKDLKGGYYPLGGTDVIDDWALRVVANGGATPSGVTVTALKTFMSGLVTDGLDTKIISMNCFVPDSLTAALTPQIVRATSLVDPWTNHNFVSGDLTVHGLAGNASNKYLDIGFNPSTIGVSNITMGYYAYSLGGGAFPVTLSCSDASHYFQITEKYSDGKAYFTDAGGSNLIIINSPPGVGGFYAQNRANATDHRAWFANSGNAFAQIGATDTNAVGAYTNYNCIAFANNSAGTVQQYSADRLSFVFFAQQMSSTDLSNLYSRVQTLRTSLGGGYV